MPRSKNSESTGIKKEKQTTNPIKATPAQKAKEAAKKAAKTSKKHKNKENNASSGTTGQQRAKPSQQKSEGVNRQRSASPDVDALKARIKELEGASNKAARVQKSAKTQKKLIPQPDGTAGEDYNLQTAMRLGNNDRTYNAIRRGVRSILDKSGLDYRVRWDRQPVDMIAKIFKVARKRFLYLENFAQDWPTKELAKSRLKNRRAYCKKQGYDATDFGMAASNSPQAIDEDEMSASGEEGDQDEEDPGMEEGSGGEGDEDDGDNEED